MPTLEWNKRWQRSVQKWCTAERPEPYGNQWGDPESSTALGEIRDRWVLPFVSPEKTALEIGPGGGRWTQYLLEFERLYCVDMNSDMFHYLLDRFGARPNLAFCQTEGTDLPGIPAGSVDFAFTFGVFVHLDPSILAEYLQSLRVVLRPGADIVLQYSDKQKPVAAALPGFAPTNGAILNYLLRASGFEIVAEDRALLPHSNVVHARLT